MGKISSLIYIITHIAHFTQQYENRPIGNLCYSGFMYYVYVLLCSDNSLYTGISNNPDQRFKDHVSGKGGRYTRLHKPVRRVHLEEAGSRSDALKRELQIKSWPREKKIRVLKLNI